MEVRQRFTYESSIAVNYGESQIYPSKSEIPFRSIVVITFGRIETYAIIVVQYSLDIANV
jgi:hypothetical protein